MLATPAGSSGMPIKDSPVRAWMPYGFYVTNAGPSLIGLLATLYLYGLPGVRRLAVQLAPWSVGRAWPVLAVCCSSRSWSWSFPQPSRPRSTCRIRPARGGYRATIAASSLDPSPVSAVAARQQVIIPLLYAIIAVGLVWRYGAVNLAWRDRVAAGSPETLVNNPADQQHSPRGARRV